jgi:molybdenum cofactor guanylyltransferase
MIDHSRITGLILAGGRGSRMGGVDKGLELLDGEPLVSHAVRRLGPQVGSLMINANRHLDQYSRFNFPVWPDAQGDFAGPLAGFLSGLTHCPSEWLMTVPCDSPRFPLDLVARLSDAIGEAKCAIPVTIEDGQSRTQPVFCLLKRDLSGDLAEHLASGERKIDRWLARHACVEVPFADAGAFLNANTLEELRRLEGQP